jgi:eukaryotic-like serine/threonine-protein kinase
LPLGKIHTHDATRGLAGLLVGREVSGRYRVDAVLGAGGMGVVYAATHLLLGSRVALKVLLPHLAQHEAGRLRFHREARVAARLEHPAIARVFDFGEDPACGPYLVMEFLEGIPLSRLIVAPPSLEPGAVLEVAEAVLAALSVAHRAGVVHRDVKPSNIFLAREGERVAVKLLDFGVASLEDEQAALALTRTGAPLGTPRFQAPEQAADAARVDGRADIYALGATLYAALTGEAPLPAGTGEPPPLRRRCASLPEPLLALVERAMARQPEDRFPDASSAAAAVASVRRRLYPTAALSSLLLAPALPLAAEQPTATGSLTGSPPQATSPPSLTPLGNSIAPPFAVPPPGHAPRWSPRSVVAGAALASALGALGLWRSSTLGGPHVAATSQRPEPSSRPSSGASGASGASGDSGDSGASGGAGASGASAAPAAPAGPAAKSPAPGHEGASAPSGSAPQHGLPLAPSLAPVDAGSDLSRHGDERPLASWPVSEATLRGRLVAGGWSPVGPAEYETFPHGSIMRLRARRGEQSGVVEQRRYAQAAHVKRAAQEAEFLSKASQAQPGGLITASVFPDRGRSAELLRLARGGR